MVDYIDRTPNEPSGGPSGNGCLGSMAGYMMLLCIILALLRDCGAPL